MLAPVYNPITKRRFLAKRHATRLYIRIGYSPKRAARYRALSHQIATRQRLTSNFKRINAQSEKKPNIFKRVFNYFAKRG